MEKVVYFSYIPISSGRALAHEPMPRAAAGHRKVHADKLYHSLPGQLFATTLPIPPDVEGAWAMQMGRFTPSRRHFEERFKNDEKSHEYIWFKNIEKYFALRKE